MVCPRINCLFSRMHTKNVKKHGAFGSFTHRSIIFSTRNVQRLFTHNEIAQLSSAITSPRHTDTQKPSVSAPIPVSLLTATSATLPPGSLYPWLRAMKGCTGRQGSQKWSWATLTEKEIHHTMKEFLLKEQLHAPALLGPLSPMGTYSRGIRSNGDSKVTSAETCTHLKHKEKKKSHASTILSFKWKRNGCSFIGSLVKKLLYINAVLLNFLLIQESWKKSCHAFHKNNIKQHNYFQH